MLITTRAARYVRGQPETIEYYFLYLFSFYEDHDQTFWKCR